MKTRKEKTEEDPFSPDDPKINKTLTLHASVVHEVEKRLVGFGGKISALTEELLISWCIRWDQIMRMAKQKGMPEMGERVQIEDHAEVKKEEGVKQS